MRRTIESFLRKSGSALTKGSRTVLEALLDIATDETVSVTSETLRGEIERRHGCSLTPDTYRQRMRRLAKDLDAAKAPFRLSSNRGRVAAQPNLIADKETRIGDQLSEHSDEKTRKGSSNTVPPQARPSHLTVMFSYAWLDAKQQHKVQIEFFNALANLLKYPPAGYAGPEIRLWRDEKNIRKSLAGQEQIKSLCHKSFFCLLMLSNKYHHSHNCIQECDCFLTQNGEQKSGKYCLVVPVNVSLEDAPERFRRRVRIWMTWDGKNLLELWTNGNEVDRQNFVRGVANEIWDAAAHYPGTTPAAIAHDLEPPEAWCQRIEVHASTRVYQHSAENKAPIFGREGRMSRDLSDTPSEMGRIEIVPHLAQWATDPEGPRLVALLADFGMGKTVTCQLLTQELLTKHLTDARFPLPIYLDLRDIDRPEEADATPLETLIDQMLRRAGENPPSGAEVIEYARDRDALIIFDGLDEVTNKLTTSQANRLYRELLSIIPADVWQADLTREDGQSPNMNGPRILMSCRTHYFKDIAAQRSFFSGQEREGLAPDKHIKTYYLLPFSTEQIEKFLRFFFEEAEAIRALSLIEETYNLQELAERPVFLEFIRQTIGRIEEEKHAGRTVNITRLYDIFIEQSLGRDNPKHVLPIREKKRLLASLALSLHKKRRDALSVDALEDWFDEVVQRYPKLNRALSGGDSLSNAERFLQDLRNASFLVRPGSDEFRFGHTSVREYFLANALHQAVCDRDVEGLNVPQVSQETIVFLLCRQTVADAESRETFLRNFPCLLEEGRPSALRKLAFDIWLASGAQLPRPAVMDLSDLDFSRRILRGTKGSLLPLASTIWRSTKLRQTEFDHVALDNAIFDRVEAPMSLWLSCQLVGAKWDNAVLVGSQWRGCHLDAGAVHDLDCRDAKAFACSLGSEHLCFAELPKAGSWQPTQPVQVGITCVVLGRIGDHDAFVTGGYVGALRVWDATSGESLAVLKGHMGKVNCVALATVGNRDLVVSGGEDRTLRIWDGVTGQSLAVLKGHRSAVMCAALGKVGNRDVIVSGGGRTLRIWDTVTGQSLAVLKGHKSAVMCVALGKVGNRDVIVSGGGDAIVHVWDATSGKSIAVLEGHQGVVNSVALGQFQDRDVVVSGGGDGTVRVWDATTAESLAMREEREGEVSQVFLGRFKGRDVVFVTSLYGHTVAWDLVSDSLPIRRSGRLIAMGRIAGRDVVVHGASTLVAKDLESGDTLIALSWSNVWVTAVALGRVNGRDVFISGSRDRTVHVCDAMSGESVALIEGQDGETFALGRINGRDVIVSGSTFSRDLSVCDAVSGERIVSFKGYKRRVISVALGKVGDRDVIITGGDDSMVYVWDTTRGSSIASFQHPRVKSVALGRFRERDVAVSGSRDGALRIWDIKSGESLAVLKGHKVAVNCLALGPIGEKQVIVSGGDDGTVRIWSADGLGDAVLEGHQGGVNSVALGRIGDRDVVVSGGEDGTVRIWEAKSCKVLAVLKGHNDWVRSVALGQIGGRDVILSGGDDATMRLWDTTKALANKDALAAIFGPDASTFLYLAPSGTDGDRIARCSQDIWRHFLAEGQTPDGRIIIAPIEEMMDLGALAEMSTAVRD